MKNYQLSIERYQTYKNSEIEWLGEVPEHWEIKKFNHIAQIVEGQIDPKEEPYKDYVLIAPNHIESGTGRLLYKETAFDQSAESGKYLFRANDVIYSKIRPALKKVWKANFPGICSADMYPIRLLKGKIEPNYFIFLCLSESFSNFMIATSMRVAMPKVNRDDFHECHFVIPLLPEQKSIAQYLDTKTAQIDRKIDLLTQKAKSYADLKRSLINETVTRGRDRSVPMKDSGIEWIGEVPEHWGVTAVTGITTTVSIKNYPDEELLSVYRDYGVIIKSTRDDNHNRAGENLAGYKLVEPGFLVINKMKAWQGSLGVSEFRGIVSPAYITCKTNKRIVERSYLHHLLRCRNYIHEYNRLSYGVRVDQWDMRYDDFKYVPVLLPPLSEQKAIADYLDTKTTQIDQIIQTINTQIEKLKELRKTLINDVVTGKIKVAED